MKLFFKSNLELRISKLSIYEVICSIIYTIECLQISAFKWYEDRRSEKRSLESKTLDPSKKMASFRIYFKLWSLLLTMPQKSAFLFTGLLGQYVWYSVILAQLGSSFDFNLKNAFSHDLLKIHYCRHRVVCV